MHKVIVILPKRLGDTLFCTSAIRFLHKNNPSLEIGAIACSTLSAELLKNNPAIKQIFLAEEVNIEKIKREYSEVLKIHLDTDVSAWIEKLQLPVINLTTEREPNEHIAAYYLRALSKRLNLPIKEEDKTYFIYPSPEDVQVIEKLFESHELNKEALLIGLHLGCHSIAKRKWLPWPFRSPLNHEKVWPIKKFIELANLLNQYNSKITFILTGSKTENILAEQFINKIPNSVNLVGKTSVHQLKLLCDKVKLYISSDTGPLHVACASQCMVIALVQNKLIHFGTGPFPINNKNYLLSEENLSDLLVEDVYKKVITVL